MGAILRAGVVDSTMHDGLLDPHQGCNSSKSCRSISILKVIDSTCRQTRKEGSVHRLRTLPGYVQRRSLDFGDLIDYRVDSRRPGPL